MGDYWREKATEAILRSLKRAVGRENAVPLETLVRDVNASCPSLDADERYVRERIEELRRETDIGALICSSAGQRGRWMATSLNEVVANYREERRRSLELLVTMRKRLSRAKAHFGGQLTLLGGPDG